jgi:hypothetical protein
MSSPTVGHNLTEATLNGASKKLNKALSSGSMTPRVLKPAEDTTHFGNKPQEKKGYWQKVKNFFTSIYDSIKNFFSNLFGKKSSENAAEQTETKPKTPKPKAKPDPAEEVATLANKMDTKLGFSEPTKPQIEEKLKTAQELSKILEQHSKNPDPLLSKRISEHLLPITESNLPMNEQIAERISLNLEEAQKQEEILKKVLEKFKADGVQDGDIYFQSEFKKIFDQSEQEFASEKEKLSAKSPQEAASARPETAEETATPKSGEGKSQAVPFGPELPPKLKAERAANQAHTAQESTPPLPSPSALKAEFTLGQNLNKTLQPK